MISSKFYNQISKCPVCNGWGNIKKETSNKRDECIRCGGRGIFLAWTDNIFFFGAPTFVDYKNRNKIIILKLITASVGIIFLLITVFALNQLIKNLL